MKEALTALVALSALTALSTQAAVTSKTPRYSVSMTMFDAKSIVKTPRKVALAHEVATVRTGSGKQIFEMMVTPDAKGQFQVRGNLVQWTPRGLVTSDAFTNAVADGKPRCITIFKRDRKTGKSVPVHVDVVISNAN